MALHKGKPGSDDESLKKTNKKKSGFWSRLFSCFAPSLDQDHLDSEKVITSTATNKAKVEGSEKAESKVTTDETAISTLQGSGHAHDQTHPTVPTLTIPGPPVVITAPNTPSYNTFDLPGDGDIIIPPTPKGSHLLPVDETEGVTSGAVQPPGSTAPHHTDKEREESDGGSYTDDDFHDAREEEDLDAEEMRLIMNCGSGIPIVDGVPKPLLPPLAEALKGRKCLVSLFMFFFYYGV